MLAIVPSVRRVLWIVWACAILFLPRVGAAQSPLFIDLDGDGVADVVTHDRAEPSNVRIWLSRTGTSRVIRSPQPLVRVIAADLDGDQRLELVAADARGRLRFWTPDAGKAFHTHRSHRPARLVRYDLPKASAHATGKSFDEEPADTCDALTGYCYLEATLIGRATPIDIVLGYEARAPERPLAVAFGPYFAPFTSRPPPAFI